MGWWAEGRRPGAGFGGLRPGPRGLRLGFHSVARQAGRWRRGGHGPLVQVQVEIQRQVQIRTSKECGLCRER